MLSACGTAPVWEKALRGDYCNITVTSSELALPTQEA